jgi:hypothetical protein
MNAASAAGLNREEQMSRIILWAATLGTAAFGAARTVDAAETRSDETADPDNARGTFGFLLENDEVAGTDRHYTNGMEFTWLSAPMQSHSNWRYGLALGQQIYTPNDTDTPLPLPGERPYAGWLYAGFSLVMDRGDELDTWVLNLGVVGPSAQGEWLQREVHRRIGSHQSYGWDNQLADEIGGQLIYDHRWRALWQTKRGGLGADVTPHVGLSLGNVATYANAGFTLRLGNDLRDDYGVPHIRPSLPGTGYFEPNDAFGWYLFAGVDGRAVARNIFLDGNTGRESLSVDKAVFVADLQAGVAVSFSRVRLAYTYVYRTREYRGQPAPDRFGSVSISALF